VFIRGGDASDGRGAREHLERKYRFGRSRISSADEFIRYIASASSLTGAAYRVRCPQGESLAGTWLTRELERYRTAAPR
jgi:hypothetical protein